MSNLSRTTYSGSSVGGKATMSEAVRNALSAAASGENANHFSWTLITVRGDFGGVVGQTITAEIAVYSR